MERTKEIIAELQDAQGKEITNESKKYSLKIVSDFGTECYEVWKTSKFRAIMDGLYWLKMYGAKSGSITCIRIK